MDLKSLIAKMDQIESKKFLTESEKKESKRILNDAAPAVAASGSVTPSGVASNALKGMKLNALISGGYAVYNAWTQIKELPADLPEDKRRIEVTRIVSKVVAETGLVLAGTVFGALVGGLFFGVGAIPGFFAGFLGGTIAQATLGDSVKEIVDKIVDYLNETNPSVAGAAPAAQATPSAVPPVGSKPAAPVLRPGADPKVAALQQKLVAQGAKIRIDGFMGPKTQLAMKQFPITTMAESIKDTKMTESEKIAALRNKLARLDEAPSNRAAGQAAVKGIKIAATGDIKESSWTDMKGNKHAATKVKGKSYGNQPEPKEVDSEGKAKKKVKEGLGIAKGLLKSFGLTEAELTPDQQQKMGGANLQDPYIVARILGKDAVPLSHFKDPEDQKIAKQLGFKDAPAPAADDGTTAGIQSTIDQSKAATDDGTTAGIQATIDQPKAAAPAADAKKVARFKELLAKAGQGPAAPAAAPAAKPAAAPAAKPAPGQAAKPVTTGATGITSSPSAAGRSYQIKPGDNLTKIAQANGTTVQAIMAANPQIKDPNKISAGANLTLPGAPGQSPKPAAPGKAVPAAPGSMMGDIDPLTGMPSNPMTESAQISRLRKILEDLDRPKQVDENRGQLALKAGELVSQGAANLGSRIKHMGKAVEVPRTALPAPAAAANVATAAKPGMSTAGKLGTAANIGAAAYGVSQMGGGQSDKPAAPTPGQPAKPAAGQSSKPAAAGGAPAAALSTQEEGEMGVLAQELSDFMGQDPALDALLLQYEKMRPGAANAQP